MLVIAWIIGVIFGIGIGGMIATRMKNKCNHKWELIESSNIFNAFERHVGWIKVYECEHCKKMKKEQIKID
jgi:hypothetical protein